ncbi:helix-turn-helix domain-containing protein [Mitsuaria sp. GD03876]|uniref:helix-turn-helix domain-containing protein n=1 Tax=Mitsuaria sp. GD03876 TaxID=2975399 RepID=UPI00244AAA3B|nr:helix-turn-helix domain-containing protein [Mitsuaria sp. GD03876]MDH0867359.1 helix-turn-helix domain-containing protein [Mitsuaria sp. GD03876]
MTQDDPAAGSEARSRRRKEATPVYALYGEDGRSPALDGLHLESIADRSRLHNWEIQPHRHGALVQLLLIERGRVTVRMDETECVLRAPALVWVPALAVHGFRFAPETEGLVVTLDQARLCALLDHLPDLLESLAEPRLVVLDRGATVTRALFAVGHALREDYASAGAWRGPALDHAVALLATQAARFGAAEPAHHPAGEGRSLQHLARYREQVERHYRHQPPVAELAAPLGITPTQLNRLCRRHLQCSALAVLHQRVLLEAKRELGYTNLMVRQIADGLGFADPAYFTRFFLRHTGQSPSAWREQGAGR